MRPTKEAVRLLFDGSKALADVEQAGIKIDVDRLKANIASADSEIASTEQTLKKDPIWAAWRRKYGDTAKLGNRDQLGQLVFGDMKYPCLERTETGRPMADAANLLKTGLPFCKTYVELEHLKKASGTFLKGILAALDPDGFLHPFFHLHKAVSGRGCVAKGTLIEVVRDVSKAPKGVPIEKVKAGDLVYCFDDNRKLTIRKVLWSGKTGHREVLRLHWEARGKTGFLDVTPEHKIRMINGEYVEAQNLRVGDDYRSETEGRKSPKTRCLAIIPNNHKIVRIERLTQTVDVYDLEVEEHHNFIANEICVHNSSSGPNFQNFPARNPKMAKMIRECFIPRKGRRLVEIDFSGVEVRVSACLIGSTEIETIDGPQRMDRVCERVTAGEIVYVYGYNEQEKRVSVSRAVEGGITRQRAAVWNIVLDSGEVVTATPDHKFLLRDGRYVPLQDLQEGDSLMPFYRTTKRAPWGTNYSKIYLNDGSSMMAHNLIALDVMGVNIGKSNLVVHHKDGKGTNNSLSNIEVMDRSDHMRIHVKDSWEKPQEGNRRFEWHRSEAGREFARERMAQRKREWGEKEWEEFGWRISEGIRKAGGLSGQRNPMFGKSHSQETKRKISQAKIGKKTGRSWNRGMTKENHPSLAKMSKTKQGRPGNNKGKKLGPMSEEQKKKISQTLTGRKASTTTRKKCSTNKAAYWKRIKESPPACECPICGNKFRSLAPHMSRKHGITPNEYRRTYNHKVVRVESAGYADVYNLTVEGVHNYALRVGVIAKNCYNKDPKLIRYIVDPTTDMHRDRAMELFFLTADQVQKKTTRDWSKNRFVFPQFYGSVYFQCAPHLWEAVTAPDSKLPDGTLVLDHLRKHGVTELGDCDPKKPPRKGTFEARVKQVEDWMWNRDFVVFTEWKKRRWEEYVRQGYVTSLTGFVFNWGTSGILERNDVLNYGTQGAAFHCLLWCLIQAHKWLRKNRMKTLIVGQIHDSILLDADERELQDVLDKVVTLMTKDLLDHWKWIIVPMGVEAEVSDVDGNWFNKRQWAPSEGGIWSPAA